MIRNFEWKILKLRITDARFKKIYISRGMRSHWWYVALYGADIFLSSNNRPDVYKLLIRWKQLVLKKILKKFKSP